MTDTFFEKIAEIHRLGTLTKPVNRVSGGFLHKMYRLDTEKGTFACKLLNPEIMARPTAAGNFDQAEMLETVLEKAGLPVVTALETDGKKRQTYEGTQYYLFPWIDGKALTPTEITAHHCHTVASLLAGMHNLEPRVAEEPFSTYYPHLATDWQSYVLKAEQSCPEIADELRTGLTMLQAAEEKQNQAIAALPDILCISHGDMDPKNVLWQNETPYIIDLECLDRDNPATHAVQLALQWSGIYTGVLDIQKVTAFLKAYIAEADWMRGTTVDWASLVGLGYSWTDWAEYNLRRALGLVGNDETEIQMGIEQFRLAMRCIATLTQAEAVLREKLSAL